MTVRYSRRRLIDTAWQPRILYPYLGGDLPD